MKPTPSHQSSKLTAAWISLLANVILVSIKTIALFLTSSVTVASETLHTLTDLVASLVVVLSVRAASAPPDAEHPYGHAKIESITGLGEGILLVTFGVGVIIASFRHFATGATLDQPELGMAILAVSAALSLAIGIYLRQIGLRTKSHALQSNGAHFMTDFYTCLAALVSIFAIKVTKAHWIDGAVALILGVILIHSGWKMVCVCFEQLIDRRLPDSDLEAIRAVVNSHPGVLSMHRLRTRLSGDVRYIDFHVVVPTDWTLLHAHDLADQIEDDLEAKLAPATVVIHVDPYDPIKAAKGQSEN